ncbi:hypothetical protein R3P38DRAFT_3240090 [Favolaschia claudopus]|uniref:Uncharacterized protein n=1 Tax=Favolaschia claudopus TaxID=2862362 RepID=A0AAV9Z7H8_9AGAR
MVQDCWLAITTPFAGWLWAGFDISIYSLDILPARATSYANQCDVATTPTVSRCDVATFLLSSTTLSDAGDDHQALPQAQLLVVSILKCFTKPPKHSRTLFWWPEILRALHTSNVHIDDFDTLFRELLAFLPSIQNHSSAATAVFCVNTSIHALCFASGSPCSCVLPRSNELRSRIRNVGEDSSPTAPVDQRDLCMQMGSLVFLAQCFHAWARRAIFDTFA